MIKNMEQCELDAVLTVADKMVTAAKTAPKASGQGQHSCRCRHRGGQRQIGYGHERG